MSGFCSMFSQLLRPFPRTEFQALVKRIKRGSPSAALMSFRCAARWIRIAGTPFQY